MQPKREGGKLWLDGVEGFSSGVWASSVHGNGWCFEVLISSRRIASSWLDKIADDAGASRGPLRSAAGSFATLVDMCMQVWIRLGTWRARRDGPMSGRLRCAALRLRGSSRCRVWTAPQSNPSRRRSLCSGRCDQGLKL